MESLFVSAPSPSLSCIPERIPMIRIPLLFNEQLPVLARQGFLLVDVRSEKRFDRITAFAAKEFNVSIALISLVDKDRLWFKSRVGVKADEVWNDMSFCASTITASQTLVVEDALDDLRFVDNAMVVGAPYVRFYAGSVLGLGNGQIIGTLGVMDYLPRRFDKVDLAVLEGLRDLVIEELMVGLAR